MHSSLLCFIGFLGHVTVSTAFTNDNPEGLKGKTWDYMDPNNTKRCEQLLPASGPGNVLGIGILEKVDQFVILSRDTIWRFPLHALSWDYEDPSLNAFYGTEYPLKTFVNTEGHPLDTYDNKNPKVKTVLMGQYLVKISLGIQTPGMIITTLTLYTVANGNDQQVKPTVVSVKNSGIKKVNLVVTTEEMKAYIFAFQTTSKKNLCFEGILSRDPDSLVWTLKKKTTANFCIKKNSVDFPEAGMYVNGRLAIFYDKHIDLYHKKELSIERKEDLTICEEDQEYGAMYYFYDYFECDPNLTHRIRRYNRNLYAMVTAIIILSCVGLWFWWKYDEDDDDLEQPAKQPPCQAGFSADGKRYYGRSALFSYSSVVGASKN